MTIDIQNFEKKLAHQLGRDGKDEESDFKAYQLDTIDDKTDCLKDDKKNGLKLELGFKNHEVSCVDYFYFFQENPHSIYLIELTDLKEAVAQCQQTEEYLLELTDDNDQKLIDILSTKPKRAKELIQNKTWFELAYEFQKKWLGSIAIIERYYRYKKIEYEIKPSLKLIIVVKNYQETKEIDKLRDKLVGMLGKVTVLNTDQVSNFFADKKG